MYPDPKRIRNNKHTVRFDDYEQAVLTALANYQGEQLAVLIRDIVMREATAVLAERNTSILDRAGA
ncbi:TPA: hypothetical protein ACT5CR_002054 [Burkholderia cenocepacia]|uniref:Transcriptional regulator n=3 Tax=root TaxID=1 RepID=A0AAE9G8I5_9CAUD|nr:MULTISPECIES: hypothetical protein [Burkholderia]UNY41751.1 transcriptional regulator [Burkholderia phage Milagro]UNY41864.1 hypothetical protein CPT_Momento_034 [Burkholderia phage Momento]KAB0640873.1 hypothetical protein F7R25_02485 [Burkholderia stagnalis]KVO46790.1 hypothetical protein WT17_07625 [Burkholderia stagnalis]KVO68209.1 hypothetical protein WT19_23300 [Burkholderia stagnalis]